jgi:hypothetical protein
MVTGLLDVQQSTDFSNRLRDNNSLILLTMPKYLRHCCYPIQQLNKEATVGNDDGRAEELSRLLVDQQLQIVALTAVGVLDAG